MTLLPSGAHCPTLIGFDPNHPFIHRPTTTVAPPNVGVLGAFFYVRGTAVDPCDPPLITGFAFGWYFSLSICLISIFLTKFGKISPISAYKLLMGAGILNDVIFLYNFFHYYMGCKTCSSLQVFIDLFVNIQAQFWTSDFVLEILFLTCLIIFASARFGIPGGETLYMIMLMYMTTPAVGGMYAYAKIEEYYQIRKRRPNKIKARLFWMFLIFFLIVIGFDFYYLNVFSRKGLSIYPADFDPRVNFQLLLYYEAFMSPAILLEAMTVMITYIAFPIMIITNLPSHWNIIIKLVVSFISIITSFVYVAAILGFTIIGYEFLANYWPSSLEIVGFEHDHEE